MSYDVQAVRAAVASALEPLVTAGVLVESTGKGLSSPNPPCAMVTNGRTKFDEAMGGGLDCLALDVLVVFGLADEAGAQDALDTLRGRGALSVKALLESDPTLGGAVDDLRVTDVDRDRIYELSTGSVFGAVWSVEVLVSG